MPSATTARFMRARCDILRVPAPVAGKAQDAAAHLSEVRCTPMIPLNNEIAVRAGIESPATTRVVYVDADLDVKGGDVLVMDGKHYPIRYAGRYDMAQHAMAVTEVVVSVVQTERR